MLNKTKSFQRFLLLIRPTYPLINQWLTSSRRCGCCVDCIRWLSCPIADVFKKNFERREKNSHAGNRTRAMAVKTPDPNHQTTWDMQKPDMRNISSILPLINPQSERN